MKNFIFKSSETDLQKMFQYLETQQKNILYLTYQVDKILKIARANETNKGLQKQVDEYFEQDPFGSAFVESTKAHPEDSQDLD